MPQRDREELDPDNPLSEEDARALDEDELEEGEEDEESELDEEEEP